MHSKSQSGNKLFEETLHMATEVIEVEESPSKLADAEPAGVELRLVANYH